MTPTAPHATPTPTPAPTTETPTATAATSSRTVATSSGTTIAATAPASSATTAVATADEEVLAAVAELLDDNRWCAQLERVATLSHRELAILIQLGSGASNSTIVRRLGITEHTVKAHIGRILAKLRLESRLQAGLVGYLWARSARPAR